MGTCLWLLPYGAQMFVEVKAEKVASFSCDADISALGDQLG